jgi:hypothetical protein
VSRKDGRVRLALVDNIAGLPGQPIKELHVGEMNATTGLLLTIPSWTMCTCIPESILGPGGYLSEHQTRIEEMTLITDVECLGNNSKWGGEGLERCCYDLSAFVHLRKFSWTGMQSRIDMSTLTQVLRGLSHQLVELDLDLVHNHNRVLEELLRLPEDECDKFFTRQVLGLPHGNRKCIFPALQVLSLSRIPFDSVARDLACAFDFGSLRALRIWHCEGWDKFLINGGRVSCPSRLESLEIAYCAEMEDSSDRMFCGFLGSFQGLKKLVVLNYSPWATSGMWEAAMHHHRDTLKVFVHHLEPTSDDEETEDEVDEAYVQALEQLVDTNLEFLGIRCRPESFMVKCS